MGRVFTATLPVDDHAAEYGWNQWLDDDEQARAGRFVVLADRQAFRAAHALRRAMVAAVLGCAPADVRFTVDQPGGKPRVAGGGGLDVSLSHCRGAVACVVGEGCRVGIDVERSDRPFPPEVLAMIAAPAEQPWAAERAVPLWTLKEALTKAVGWGLAIDFTSLSLAPDPWWADSLPPQFAGAGWRLRQWSPYPGIQAAQAVGEAVTDESTPAP
ncbi:4'-phosphopantetheinyl transferase family protein [Insolitispirillum peregrinum]|uniref:4'-phosphopantetheinyl transferase family protein n=1 Tax=Insolitispirillum peregrinum TaxID=80876 RepID=UPI00361B18FF